MPDESRVRNRGSKRIAGASERGDAAAARWLELTYAELRRLAAAYLRGERVGHTFQPTALVHEAYLRLVGSSEAGWRDRRTFVAAAATMMRRILVDHARRRSARKRGGGRLVQVALDDDAGSPAARLVDLLALDDALGRLADRHPRCARVVELRFFGGLSTEDVARVLDVSRKTVVFDWRFARCWLSRELEEDPT